MTIKTIFIITICSGTLLLTGCASDKKAATKAYAQGQTAYAQQNYDASFQEIQKAAQAGDPDAEYALAYMYYYGKGTPQNTPAAVEWMRKAAAQGQAQAIKALELINKQQNPSVASASMHPTEQASQPEEEFALSTNQRQHHLAATNKAQPKAMSDTQNNQAKSVQQRKLMQQHGGYTLQLLGSFDKDMVVNFMRKHDLVNRAAFYQAKHQGRDWYVVVYGHYSTISEAKSALAALPASLRKQNPWIKPMSDVRASIDQHGATE